MKTSVALVMLAFASRGALATFDGLPPMGEYEYGQLISGLKGMFGDVAEEFRAYIDGANMTAIKADWEKYQGLAGNQRRLNAITIEEGGESKSLGGVKDLVEDAFAAVVNLSKDGLDNLALLKTDFEIPTKGAAIEKVMGYMPDFTHWADETHASVVVLMENLKDAETFDEATAAIEDAADEFCTDEIYEPPEKVPTNCEGPRVRLEFLPKKCIVVDHEIECRPAQLVLAKRAGRCTMKHYSPAKYIGKQCRFEKDWGKDSFDVFGGDEYTVGKVSDHIDEAIQ